LNAVVKPGKRIFLKNENLFEKVLHKKTGKKYREII